MDTRQWVQFKLENMSPYLVDDDVLCQVNKESVLKSFSIAEPRNVSESSIIKNVMQSHKRCGEYGKRGGRGVTEEKEMRDARREEEKEGGRNE